MTNPKAEPRTLFSSSSRGGIDINDISQRILQYANRAVPTVDFINTISQLLIESIRCEQIEIWLKESEKFSRYRTTSSPGHGIRFQIVTSSPDTDKSPSEHRKPDFDMLCYDLVEGDFDPSLPCFTKQGGCVITDADPLDALYGRVQDGSSLESIELDGTYKSIALIPIIDEHACIGLLQLKSKRKDYFTLADVTLYERAVKSLAISLVTHRAQAALHERVKELVCLYSIARISEKTDVPLDDILSDIAQVLPPAWQHPEITSSRITLDDKSYTTDSFKSSYQRQKSPIVVKGIQRGYVEVAYRENKPDLDEGPFLKEERNLIDTIAHEVALIIERRETEEEKSKLEDQLRHSDRLATIGQIAAGVAHELNEPLSNILGFAQLAGKTPHLPPSVEKDLEKIVKATLHSREIIKKLVSFARQMPPQKKRIHLNEVIEEALYFFESRCSKEGIDLVRSFSTDLPEIVADPVQITQILVNLVVNSLQSTPERGRIVVKTSGSKDHVTLLVQDTGSGMDEEVMEQIFLPFFTTKEAGDGTGLGLAVVQGIVTSYGGTIQVKSNPSEGTAFEIKLPVAGSFNATDIIEE